MRLFKFITGAAIIAAAAAPAESQPPSAGAALTYADLADLALTAPVAAHVELRKAVPLKREAAAGVRPGETRFYVEADLISLIKGPGGLPARVSYLVDLPNPPGRRPPRLRGESQHIVLAATVAGRPGELRLAAPDAQLPFDPATAGRLRDILGEASRADAPPPITGIGRAFHVPGALPGESETQIFLQTADGRPVSLSVLRRPGETPLWAVALSEIVDDAAAEPRPETLLWYRLACSLPAALPAASLAAAEPGQSEAIRMDYRLVKARLGPCLRNRRPR
ncbi:MAG TPA: hypothetical protein VGW34_06750 [Allosphingosinicella sp.]|nr:hypothetical protein [Allosphingosinicella sp.]